MKKILFFITLILLFASGCGSTSSSNQKDILMDIAEDKMEEETGNDVLVEQEEDSCIPEDVQFQDLLPEEIVKDIPADNPVEDSCKQEQWDILKGPYVQKVTTSSIMISWESDKSMCAPEVTYWTSSGDKKNTAGTSAKMQTSGCGLPLPAPEGYENTVSISGLKSATLYNFTINQTAESGHFTTAPDNNTTEFFFAAVGDTRTGDEEHEDVIAQMVTKNPLFYVHDGDLVSAGISLDEWKTFFDIEKPLMKNSVIFPALGNHEIGGECYFTEYFHLPEGNSSYPTNYSFSFGSTAFVVLDTNQSIVTDPLFSWIEEELKKLSGHPYLFVLMHAPIYTFSKHSPYKDGKKILHPLFLKYGVRAVFAGHNHCYEHFKVDGINYFTIGSAGAPLYDADDNVIDYEKQKYWITAGSFYHYALFSVSDNKITGKIFKVDGSKETLFETVTIYPD